MYDWLQASGRWSDKTVSAKLAAIRRFERFLDGKAFAKVTKLDAARYRDHLKSSVEEAADRQLSISWVRHEATHIKMFIEWLVLQKGFRRLNQSLASYFDLPKKFDATILKSRETAIPTVIEADEMLESMPSRRVKQRRDRAMFAIAFLAALRADTITSLLMMHFEESSRIVVQDAQRSRTKNGKSLRIMFFPLPAVFSEIVISWKEEMADFGLSDEDAFFPDDKFLAGKKPEMDHDLIKPMSSTHAVSEAFKIASECIDKSYSPHSAKHCIGQLSLTMCRTPEQLKAWSMNMGHEGEDVTNKYYKQIPEARVFEIFEQFDTVATNEDEDKELMLRFHEHELVKGTPEFERARRLVSERRSKLALG